MEHCRSFLEQKPILAVLSMKGDFSPSLTDVLGKLEKQVQQMSRNEGVIVEMIPMELVW